MPNMWSSRQQLQEAGRTWEETDTCCANSRAALSAMRPRTSSQAKDKSSKVIICISANRLTSMSLSDSARPSKAAARACWVHTFGHKLLPPEGHTAAAAVTCLHKDACSVKVAHLCWQGPLGGLQTHNELSAVPPQPRARLQTVLLRTLQLCQHGCCWPCMSMQPCQLRQLCAALCQLSSSKTQMGCYSFDSRGLPRTSGSAGGLISVQAVPGGKQCMSEFVRDHPGLHEQAVLQAS